MRVSVLIAAALLLGVPASAQPQNQVDLKIRGVGLGSAHSSVIKRLGKPARQKVGKPYFSECSESRETSMTLNYPGLQINLAGDGRGRNLKVTSIELTSANWSVDQKLSIGASTETVLARFGTPVRTENEAGMKRLIYFHAEDGGAIFNFRSGKLVKIGWALDLC